MSLQPLTATHVQNHGRLLLVAVPAALALGVVLLFVVLLRLLLLLLCDCCWCGCGCGCGCRSCCCCSRLAMQRTKSLLPVDQKNQAAHRKAQRTWQKRQNSQVGSGHRRWPSEGRPIGVDSDPRAAAEQRRECGGASARRGTAVRTCLISPRHVTDLAAGTERLRGIEYRRAGEAGRVDVVGAIVLKVVLNIVRNVGRPLEVVLAHVGLRRACGGELLDGLGQ